MTACVHMDTQAANAMLSQELLCFRLQGSASFPGYVPDAYSECSMLRMLQSVF